MTPMMLGAVGGSLVLGFLLRRPYLRLPLHIDTGFYVSNSTICHRAFRFSRGWNALLAGCSKFLPELFYSRIYLAHGGRNYPFWSRLYALLYSWLTAVLVGVASFVLSAGSESAFVAGTILYTIVSAEPQYGGYFESGEQFEGLPQVAAVLLLHQGLTEGRPLWAGLGILLWMLQSVFIKLSSAVSGVVLAVAAVVLLPPSWDVVLGALGLSLLVYLLWIRANGRSPVELVRGLFRHEAYLSRKEKLADSVGRRVKKTVFLAVQLALGPIIPGMAVVGALTRPHPLVLVWLGGVLFTLAAQSGLVWYYALPLLPPMAVLASLAPEPWPLGAALGALLWLAVRTRLAGPRLNRAVWGLYEPALALRNEGLQHAAEDLRRKSSGRTLLVFGRWNQAYVLSDSAYDTPLVSPSLWLNTMKPGWEPELSRRMRDHPPDFLLDTEEALDEHSLRRNAGLEYRLESSYPPSFRLFAFVRSESPSDPAAPVFRPPQPAPVQPLFGLDVTNLDVQGLAGKVLAEARTGNTARHVCALNVHTLTEGFRDAAFREIFRSAFIVYPDGVPILWSSRLFWAPLKARTHGHDLVRETLRQSEGTGVGHYFLGGSAETLARLSRRVRAEFPGALLSGTYSPPFRPLTEAEEGEVADRINSAGAGILWVAFGAPRQERWIHRMKSRLRVPVLAGVGAAFDLLAGKFTRAPMPVQRMGLEWAWRLGQDPARLWRRYLSTNGFFVVQVARTVLSRLVRGA